MSLRPLHLALPLVVAVAAGCGSGSSTKTAAAPAKTTTTAAAPASSRSVVRIDNFKYLPRTLTVRAGTRVTWDNVDKTNHTVTSDQGMTLRLNDIGAGAKMSAVVKAPGTYAYHCEFHPFMHGTITVR